MRPETSSASTGHLSGLSHTDNLRRELQLQQIAMTASVQWGVFPVIVMAGTGLWRQVAHAPLLFWCTVTFLACLVSVLNAGRNKALLTSALSQLPDFTRRNTVVYFFVGSAWGSLPLICALWGTVEANWFSMVIALAALASLALILSTTLVVFASAMLPAALLILSGIVLGPLPRLELLMMTAIYIAVMSMLHRTLFRMQVERMHATVNNTARALTLARTLEHHDPLTGLFNRAGLDDWLQQQPALQDENPQALIVLGSVEGFTELNALYGTSVADSVLTEIAVRLVNQTRGMPAVARLGGAEFLLVDLRPASEPEALLHLLAQLEDEPFESGGQSVAIGMRQVWVKGNALELGTLIDHARTRLRTLGPEDSKLAALSLASRRELVASFRQALASQLIQPWFQPIVDCHTNAITGWEALARWEHPEHGLITPESFLAIARVSRQLTLLTQTMLQATTRFIQELHRHGLHDSARVHLNITASELGNPATLDWIERCLATSGVAARDIVIELSEKDALVIDERLARNLQRMQQIGMLLAIDDFGTGYANLGQLLDLPAYAIKIDKRFVEKLPQDKDSAALIRAMITLAAGLGMQAIAEGVEQEVQLDFLREHGCDACQGFRSAPALPAPAALALAKDWPAQPATA